jgi:phospholipid/cholesterol/gamma-HCH transport system permease protein
VVTVDIVRIEETNLAELVFDGEWRMDEAVPSVETAVTLVKTMASGCKNLTFDLSKLSGWDTSFVSFTLALEKRLKKNGTAFDRACLPAEMLSIIEFAAVRDDSPFGTDSKVSKPGIAVTILRKMESKLVSLYDGINFIGELIIEFWLTLGGKSKLRAREFAAAVEQAGVEALPIVVLISFLVGLILAFISIVQLNKFGAGIYCADLVGIAMMREMGCLMTAVIMSGRTGAAFASTIGTMVMNEEIDAMRTMGLSRFRFVVLPRVIALTIMMPLLCIFADIIGIYGGMFTAVAMLKMNISQYLTQTKLAISLSDVFCGLTKSVVFAILIAGIGCSKGMQCGRDAESIGKTTTSAVVTSITAIIIADAVFALIFNALGI